MFQHANDHDLATDNITADDHDGTANDHDDDDHHHHDYDDGGTATTEYLSGWNVHAGEL